MTTSRAYIHVIIFKYFIKHNSLKDPFTDMTYDSKTGWYDSSMVRGGSDFKVDFKNQEGLQGGLESFQIHSGRVNMGQEWSGWFQMKFKGSTRIHASQLKS